MSCTPEDTPDAIKLSDKSSSSLPPSRDTKRSTVPLTYRSTYLSRENGEGANKMALPKWSPKRRRPALPPIFLNSATVIG